MNFLDQHKSCSGSGGYIVRPTDKVHLCKESNRVCSLENCKKASDRARVPFSGGIVRG